MKHRPTSGTRFRRLGSLLHPNCLAFDSEAFCMPLHHVPCLFGRATTYTFCAIIGYSYNERNQLIKIEYYVNDRLYDIAIYKYNDFNLIIEKLYAEQCGYGYRHIGITLFTYNDDDVLIEEVTYAD
jgi:hypothetical protein